MINPDGRLVLGRLGKARLTTCARLSADARERVVGLIADYFGEEVRREEPRISGTLPVAGERFQGMPPPVTTAAAFSVRKRPEVIFSLGHDVQNSALVRGGGRIGPVFSQRLDLGLGSRDIADGLSKRRGPERQTIAFPGIAFGWVTENTANSSLKAS